MAKSSGSDRSLFDPLRRYIDAVVGFTEVPRERAERIVKELAERGEVRARDLQKAARELADRSARNQRDLVRLVRKEIQRQVGSLGLATKSEVERLQRRIRELERQSSSPRRSAAKPAKSKAKPRTSKKSSGR